MDDRVLQIGPSDLLAFDHFRGEIRVIPSVEFAAQSVHALASAQTLVRDLSDALRELHLAITGDDGSDADEARLNDALAEAQRLAPYESDDGEEFDLGGSTVGYCSVCGEARDEVYTCRKGGSTVPKEG